MTLVVEEDLEDYWRDILPGRWHRISLESALQTSPSYLSLGASQEVRHDAYDRASKFLNNIPRALPFRFDPRRSWPLNDIRTFLFEVLLAYSKHEAPYIDSEIKIFVRDLLRASRRQPTLRCEGFSRIAPMAGYLKEVSGADIGPNAAFDEDFVVDALWKWVEGFKNGGWGKEEQELFGLIEDDLGGVLKVNQLVWETQDAIKNPLTLQRRMAQLLLLGGAYGLFERAILIVDDINALVRTPFLQSNERRARAVQLDSLLDELDYWNRQAAPKVTVFLGWSGQTEDAVLLRGLHEPLMRKLDGSKLWFR